MLRRFKAWLRNLFSGNESKPVETAPEPIKLPEETSIEERENLLRPLNKASLELIEHFEGYYSKAYLDPVGIPTIGIGTIKYPNGQKVKMGDICTKEQAYYWLEYELNTMKKKVIPFLESINLELNDNEYGALMSFSYNLGEGVIINSGRSMNAALKSRNKNKIADAFILYDKAGGRTLRGLTRRRNAERELFLRPNL